MSLLPRKRKIQTITKLKLEKRTQKTKGKDKMEIGKIKMNTGNSIKLHLP